jgi:predicted metal-dependent HD superfamily phosphohydrolase
LASDATSSMQLDSRFGALWQTCSQGGDAGSDVWRRLAAHYAGPGRFYHNLQHLAHCLSELDAVADRVPDPLAVELAIWFHDVIYDSARRDNEARSADFFRSLADGALPQLLIDRVARLILATAHRYAVEDPLEAWVVDIDLSSFGLPWKAFRSDCDALRREQAWQSDAAFYAGKLRFLKALLEREYVFNTAHFRARHEAAARDNILRYMDELHRLGFSPV